MPTTTGVTIIGTIRDARTRRMKRTSRAQSSASASPMIVSSATARKTNFAVTQSASRNVGSFQRLVVVVEPDAAQAAAEPVEARARPDPVDQRIDHDGQHEQQGRGDQQVRDQRGRARLPGAGLGPVGAPPARVSSSAAAQE